MLNVILNLVFRSFIFSSILACSGHGSAIRLCQKRGSRWSDYVDFSNCRSIFESIPKTPGDIFYILDEIEKRQKNSLLSDKNDKIIIQKRNHKNYQSFHNFDELIKVASAVDSIFKADLAWTLIQDNTVISTKTLLKCFSVLKKAAEMVDVFPDFDTDFNGQVVTLKFVEETSGIEQRVQKSHVKNYLFWIYSI